MPYNSYYNPYQQQMNPALLQQQQMRLQQQIDQLYPQYQQLPQNQQSCGLSGRIIDNIDSVMANEVPMSGDIALFPTRDMQTIYAKQWQSDGTIKTIKYIINNETEVLSTDEQKTSYKLSDDVTNGIMKRFDELEQKIDGLLPKTTKKESAK